MDVDARGSSELVTGDAGVGFGAFFAAEYDVEVRRAFLILGNGDAAHDVVAAAFVEVYRRWDLIREPGPYLHRCVVNGCRDWARRASRSVSVASMVDVAVDGGEDAVDLAVLLLGLPFRQRAAIVLRYYDGLTEREIADSLGCRPGTVGPLISRGLSRLRKVAR